MASDPPADGSDNSTLFQRMTFYMIPCKQKGHFVSIINKHGGEMVRRRNEAEYLLYLPGDIVSNPNQVSTSFITDSIAAGKLLEVESYRYPVRSVVEKEEADRTAATQAPDFIDFPETLGTTPSESITQQTNGGRREYTVAEDTAIIEAVLKESKHYSINGNNLWEILASRQMLQRSAQSMKERFLKKILPFIDRYDISSTELKKLRTITSTKTKVAARNLGRTRHDNSLPFIKASSTASNSYKIASSSSDDGLDFTISTRNAVRKRKVPLTVPNSTSQKISLSPVANSTEKQSSPQPKPSSEKVVSSSNKVKKGDNQCNESPTNESCLSAGQSPIADQEIASSPNQPLENFSTPIVDNSQLHSAGITAHSSLLKNGETSPLELLNRLEASHAMVMLSHHPEKQRNSSQQLTAPSPHHSLVPFTRKSTVVTEIHPVDVNSPGLQEIVFESPPGVQLVEGSKSLETSVASEATDCEDFWPCSTPPETPDQSVVLPAPPKDGEVMVQLPPTEPKPSQAVDSQLSWSTFDLCSQSQGARLKSADPNPDLPGLNADLNNISRDQAEDSDEEVVNFADLSMKISSAIRRDDIINSPNIPHFNTEIILDKQRRSSGKGKLDASVTSSTHPEGALVGDKTGLSSDIETKSCDEVLPATPFKQLVISSPNAPERLSNLQKVLFAPMKESQFMDANSTLSSQPTTYVSCGAEGECIGECSDNTIVLEADTSSMVKVEKLFQGTCETVGSTSEAVSTNEIAANLQIEDCTECTKASKDQLELCRVHVLKSQPIYSKLMQDYGIEDAALFAYACAFSADWELLEQHFKSGLQVGRPWTQKHDRMLMNPNFRKKNLKELRKLFSTREIDSRKKFLLDNVLLTAKEREVLLGMTYT